MNSNEAPASKYEATQRALDVANTQPGYGHEVIDLDFLVGALEDEGWVFDRG